MTKAVLLVWMMSVASYSSPSAPAKIEFTSMAACEMAANEMVKSSTKVTQFIARCVDLGEG